MSKLRFPAIAGGCFCRSVRYRLLTSPLFCYACHCGDCQKQTGTVFGCYASIEVDLISIISPTKPIILRELRKVGTERIHAECPTCKCELWSNDSKRMGIVEVNIGTLDYPGLMEPDIHSFVESKVEWVILPPGAKTCQRSFDIRDVWPKSSLKRMEAGIKRYKEAVMKREAAFVEAKAGGGQGEVDESGYGYDHKEKEGDKTPTAVEPEAKELEDDEEFERRFKETERALQERLAKLSLKLEEKEGVDADVQTSRVPVEGEKKEIQADKESVSTNP